MSISKNILIVDDEPDIGFLLSAILKKMHFQTSYVQTLKNARKKLESEYFAAYFLDLNLPDGVGIQLTPMIKERNENAKIIVISAYDDQEDKNMIIEKSIDYFIPKPFRKKMIVDALSSLKLL